MSVGAGSIKRAARTANAGKKAEMPETVAKEVAGMAESPVGAEPIQKATDESKKQKKAAEESKKQKKATDEGSKQKKAVVEGKKQKGGEGKKKAETKATKKSAPEADLPENTGRYEAYGIGQQLPLHLL